MDDFANAIKQSIYVSLKLIVGSAVNVFGIFIRGFKGAAGDGEGDEIFLCRRLELRD